MLRESITITCRYNLPGHTITVVCYDDKVMVILNNSRGVVKFVVMTAFGFRDTIIPYMDSFWLIWLGDVGIQIDSLERSQILDMLDRAISCLQ
jgi:hypothetical protein